MYYIYTHKCIPFTHINVFHLHIRLQRPVAHLSANKVFVCVLNTHTHTHTHTHLLPPANTPMYYICQQSVQHFVHKYSYNRTLSLSLSLWLPPPLHLSHCLSLSPPTTHSVTLTHWFTSTRLQRSAHTMPVNIYTHIQFLSLSHTHASSRGYASFVTPLTYLTRLIHMRQVCRVWMRQIYLNE